MCSSSIGRVWNGVRGGNGRVVRERFHTVRSWGPSLHLACSSPVGLSCGKGGGGVGRAGVGREHRKPWVVDAGARETRT